MGSALLLSIFQKILCAFKASWKFEELRNAVSRILHAFACLRLPVKEIVGPRVVVAVLVKDLPGESRRRASDSDSAASSSFSSDGTGEILCGDVATDCPRLENLEVFTSLMGPG